MALSGSFNTTKYSTSSHGTLGLNVSWTATQNIADNTSTIKWTVKSNGTMSSGYYVKCYKVVVKINGVNVINTTSEFNMKGGGAYKKTGSIVVAHNSDGTKTVSMSAQANIYYSGDGSAQKGSSSPTLNKINRYALIASATDFTNESYPTVVYTNPAGTTLTTGLKARLTWNDGANYTDWVTLNDEGGEYTFNSSTLTAANITSMLNSCPSSNSLPVKVELQSTMGGVDYIDNKTITMSVVNADPIFTVAPSYQDANPAIVAITGGAIVQRQSKLRVYRGTASAQKGASLQIIAYHLFFNGRSFAFDGEYVEFDKPDMAGTYTANITVTDTRGNATASYINIVILEWSEPTAECGIERQNSFETDCDLLVRATIAPVDNINTLTITESHKMTTEDDTHWSTPSSVTNNVTKLVSLANASAWNVKISVSDRFTTVDYFLSVSKGVPYIYKDVYNSSVGINAIPDAENQLKVGGTIKASGDIEADGVKLHDKIQQVTLTQNVSMSSTSGYFQLSDNLDYPRADAILIGMQVRTSQVGATAGTLYSLIYWNDGTRPYIQYQRGSSSFSNISHDFIFTFYLP